MTYHENINKHDTQSIDDPHQSSGEVVRDVQHGALLPGVDEAVAADSHGEKDHGRGWMVASEGGTWGVTVRPQSFSLISYLGEQEPVP